ncbi:MAG: radical SAM/SPASM domain protein maturase [Candidatus Wallbacteria bacterium HGW-Wallbacteria-1]|jgi:uncharacterized protein|uniref:Radical SAM/SPASM domain protein maturase n=1 Tax=Candidatus Wallbacteria bacterium HGW-Wallbacteria-1 TaxID=2013854 RepID=A0A2N1PRW2_9BACT|nr:MAG: radical SAM/SPASM domain protein maturase [Candidatus Wallbacteria bacterium HGW-Wallbacteria-1]
MSSSVPALVKGVHTAKPSRYNIFIPIAGDRSLVYNSLTDAFSIWEEEDMKLYESARNQTLDLAEESLRDMVFGGYLVSDDLDELALAEGRYRTSRFYTGNLTMTLVPTMKCNFRCDYCFQGQEKDKADMADEVQDAVVAFLERHARHLDRVHIAWYGGEPLLGIGTIEAMSERILAVCNDNKLAYSSMIVTNGWHLSVKNAEILSKSMVKTIQITLDGPPEYHDQRRVLLGGQPTFDTIVENVRSIIEAKVPVNFSVRVNIDERNRDHIRELIDVLAERGLSGHRNFGLYFAPVEAITVGCHSCASVTMGKVEYARLEAGLYRYALSKGLTGIPNPPRHHGNCAAVRPKGLVVIPNGDIHKCWDTVMDASCRVGTIFDVASIKESPEYKKWMNWTPFAEDICRNCVILPNCCGFCGYKSLYSERTQGEAAAMPCPGWKNNIGERLFLRAEAMGVVTNEDWLPESAVKA